MSGLAARSAAVGEADDVREDWLRARRRCAALDLECDRMGRAAALAERGRLSPPILLKGRAVARRYRDPSLRTYADIDLLVPREQFSRWVEVLGRLGYRGGGRWADRTALRYTHEVTLRRRAGGGEIACGLHTCMFVERRARRLGYRALAPHAAPGPFPGLLALTAEAQLVVLALHYLQHRPGARRLIWLRDFLELGTPEAVGGARRLAREHGVAWALERALVEAEGLAGTALWNASPPPDRRLGLAALQRLERPGHLYHLALVRELGPVRGLLYLASRVDPRRFAESEEGALAALGVWARRVAGTTLATPWPWMLTRKP